MSVRRVAPLALCVLLSLSACAPPDEDTPHPEASSAPAQPTDAPTAEPTPSPSLDPPRRPAGSKRFRGEGYTLFIGNEGWKKTGPAVWTLGSPGTDDFASFNVVTEPLPVPYSMDSYLDAAEKALAGAITDYQRRSQEVVIVQGREYGIVEYSGAFGDSGPLRFYATVDLSETQAVIATLTSQDALWAKKRRSIRKYSTTLIAE